MDAIKAERARRGPTNAGFEAGQLESTQAKASEGTIDELITGAEIAGAGRLIGLEDEETIELLSRTLQR